MLSLDVYFCSSHRVFILCIAIYNISRVNKTYIPYILI